MTDEKKSHSLGITSTTLGVVALLFSFAVVATKAVIVLVLLLSIIGLITGITYIPHENSDDFAFRQALKFRSWHCSREQRTGESIKRYYTDISGML
jgi:hypothetical protein